MLGLEPRGRLQDGGHIKCDPDAGSIMKHWLIAACLLLSGTEAFAQTYPNRAIRLISPNPAGGANDTVSRIMATRMSGLLGVQIIVDNRGGAGGQIGAELAARAPPDGYTLLAGSVSTHSFAPIISPNVTYDPIGDFAPISLFALVQNVLVVNPSLPVDSVQALIALAKQKPETLNYASGGNGSTSHFAVAMFVSAAGIGKETLHVPYKGGAPAMIATMGNETQFYVGPIPGMVPLIAAGRVKALAITGARRSPSLPDVPTFAEAGLPAAESSGWFGLIAPAHTPPAIIARLNQTVVEASRTPEVMQGLAAQGVEPATNAPEDFARFIRATLERYRKVAKEQNLKFE
jgi:tripartite-type tricarboxylate transporter receptor subunit TctC